MLSVKQEGIKYYFFSLCYDSTWNWTPVSRAIGEMTIFYSEAFRFAQNNDGKVTKKIIHCEEDTFKEVWLKES